MSQESINQIRSLLTELDFPQRNITDMTAICVLALSDRKEREGLINNYSTLSQGARITDIINFAKFDLRRTYAENTRESIRKHSLKYLIQSTLVEQNADDPSRSTNSGKNNYTLNKEFAKLLELYLSNDSSYVEFKKQFIDEDAQRRRHEIRELNQKKIVITHKEIDIPPLSPGDHNMIEKFIVEELFVMNYKGAAPVYIGDTRDKLLYINEDLCVEINLTIDQHTKIPDVIGIDHHSKRVIICEAVASSGPIDELRKKELEEIFKDCPYPLDLYTAFLTPKMYQKFSTTIATDTTVYIVETKQKISYGTF
ncbi:hypothetical protein EH196_19340 [Bacillus sp. C1-1]|nr:hypothetical protein EH196_19340 [Bacillus sp. C1-1]